MFKRTLAALVVSLALATLASAGLSAQPARAAEGIIGAVGCSQTRDIYTGIELIGADGYWPAEAVAAYGGGAIYGWENIDSEYWDYFQAGLAANPQTTDVWVELCVKDSGTSTASAGDLAAGESIISNIRSFAPNVAIHVSAMNDYSGVVCPLTGANGPAISRSIAEHLVDEGLALEGPVVGPLDATMVGEDGCHANGAGRTFQAEQLEAYFTGVAPPSTPPPAVTPPPPSTPAPSPESSFVDVAGSVFVDDINWLVDEGITQGCNPPANDRFCPDAEVTRDQMATFLSRALGLPETAIDLFWDDANSLHEAAINSIGMAEITVGCNPPTNDRYCPTSSVTRAQMASFLVRAYDLPASTTDLFIDDTASPHEADINALGRLEITTGCNPPDGDRYCPDSTVTRAQMAAFLHRAALLRR